MPTSAQDFSKKISIIVDKSLPSWQVLNTVGHVSAYFGNQLAENFDTGDFFTTKDSIHLPRNSQYPIVIMSANSSQQLQNLAAKVRPLVTVKAMFFIKEMIETTDDGELEQQVSLQNESELVYLGVGLFGTNEELKQLTNKFKLWS